MHTPRDNIIPGPGSESNNNNNNNFQSPLPGSTPTPTRNSHHHHFQQQQTTSGVRNSASGRFSSSSIASATTTAMMMNSNNFLGAAEQQQQQASPDGMSNSSNNINLNNSYSNNNALLTAPGSPSSILLRSPPSRKAANIIGSSSATSRAQRQQQQQQGQRRNNSNHNHNHHNRTGSNVSNMSGDSTSTAANNDQTHPLFLSAASADRFVASSSSSTSVQDQARFNLFSGAPRTYQRGMTRSRSPEENEKADEPYARLLQQTLLAHQNNNNNSTNGGGEEEDEDDENGENNNDGQDTPLSRASNSLLGSPQQQPQNLFDLENVLPRNNNNNNNNGSRNPYYDVESVGAGGNSNNNNNTNHHDPLHQRNIIFANNVPSSRMGIVIPMSPPNNNNNNNTVTSPQQQLFSANLTSPQSGNSTPASRLSFVGNQANGAERLSFLGGSTSASPMNNINNHNTKGGASSVTSTPGAAARRSQYYSTDIVDDDAFARDSAASLDVSTNSNHNNSSHHHQQQYFNPTGGGNSQNNLSSPGNNSNQNNNINYYSDPMSTAESERFSWTLSSVYNANRARNFKSKAFRVIPQTPERILDAPDIMDDFYLHLLDWGSKNILAVALLHTLYLWNADSGEITQLMSTVPESQQDSTNRQNMDFITGLAWHPDGNKISVGLSNSEVQLWDTQEQKLERTYHGHTGRVGSLAWSQNVLASGGRDGTIRLHDIRLSASSGVFGLLKGHTQEVCGLSWSPCGRRLASGGNDNLVNIWDFPVRYSNGGNSDTGLGGSTMATTGSRRSGGGGGIGLDDNTSSPSHLDNSSSGIFSASSGIEDGRPLMQLRRHVAAVKGLAWNPTRRGILATGGGTADKTLCFWDINAPVSTAVPTPVNLLNNPSQLNQHPQSNLAHIHPSLAGSNPSAIQAHFSVVQTNPLHCVDTQSQICGVIWNNDGTEVCTSHGYSDNQLTLWKYPSLRRIADLTGHGSRVLHLSKSPDGEVVVSAAADETIRFWRCFATTSRLATSGRVGETQQQQKEKENNEGENGNDENNNNSNEEGRTSSGGAASGSRGGAGGGSTRKSQMSRLMADDVDYHDDWDLNLR